MSEEVKNQVELRKYLLSQTNDAQTEEIEKRLVSDEEYFQELEIIEDEIIEDFVDEKLSPEERKAFDENFIITEERQKQIYFVRALRKLVNEKLQSPPEKKPVFFDSLKSFFFSPIPAICSVLIIIGVSVFVWLNYPRQSEVLVALNKFQKNERATDARISDFDYAPKTEGTRGNEKSENLEILSAKARTSEAVLKNPTAVNYHELGRVFLAEKNFDESIKQFEKAIKLDPNIAKLNNDLGVALLEKGKLKDEGRLELFARANESFEKAIEKDKNLKEAYFNRALVIEQLNLPNQAKEAWENYLKLDSTSKWAEEARERLKKLEENKPISKTKEEILQDFLAAQKANDHEKAWQTLSRNREMITGKLIPQQLAFLFIDAKSEGNEAKAKEAIDALVYAGKLEEEKSGDLFWRDLANYYQKASDRNITKLKEIQNLFKQANEHLLDGKSKESLSDFETAQKILIREGNNVEPLMIETMSAFCLTRIDKLEQSNKRFFQLSEIAKQKKYKWVNSQALQWIGINLKSINKFSEAVSYLKNSVEITTEIDDKMGSALALMTISDIYSLLGQNEKSIFFAQDYLETNRDFKISLRQIWRNLYGSSKLFQKIGFFYTAFLYEKEALELAQNYLNDKSYDYENSVNLGLIYKEIGNSEKAIEYIQKGQELSETFTDPEFKELCYAYTNMKLGHINRQEKNYSKAAIYYQKAVQFYDSSEFQIEKYEAYKGLLLNNLAEKNDESFQKTLPKLLTIFDDYRSEILEEQNRNSFFDKEQDVYDIAVEYEFNNANIEKAFDYSEESRSRSLLDLQNSLTKITENNETPEIKLSTNFSKPLKLSQVQAEIPEKTQLLVYSVLPQKILIYLVTKDNLSVVQSEIPSGNLQEKILSFIDAILVKSGINENFELSKELYNILISPIKNKLDSNKQLIIIPDKILYHLPFNALYSDKYLIQDFTISYSTSLNVFINCSKKSSDHNSKKPENLLSIGNPAFNFTEYEELLQPLPSSKQEAVEIAKFYPSAKVLVGNEATKSKVKENLPNANVFHFAGHYLVEEKTPLLSGFVLAGNKKEESNFTNLEIIKERLSKTRLIVLSACKTGIETHFNGEGMIGAGRTFLALNVPLVIASQWSVDSQSTKDLMIRFHQLRKVENRSSAEALRQAQIEIMNIEKFKQPYYWAAFAVLGGYSQF